MPQGILGLSLIVGLLLCHSLSAHELRYKINPAENEQVNFKLASSASSPQANTEPKLPQGVMLDEKIKTLLNLMGFSESVKFGYDTNRIQMLRQIKLTYEEKSKKTMPDETLSHIGGIVDDEFNKLMPDLNSFAIDFYKKLYTTEEIDAIYEFHSSDIGYRIAVKQNRLMNQLMPEIQRFMALQFTPRLTSRLVNDPIIKSLQ